MRGVRADELEAERAKAVLAGAFDGRQLRAGHPQRRMRLLHRLRHDIAQGNVEILAVMLGADLGEHREDRLDGFLEHLALGLHVAAERRQLGDRGALAHAEFAAAVGEQIEHRDALGDARRMIGGELEDAVAEPDLFGALARGGEEGFRRRRMRIFLEEVMLDHPGVVVAAAVGGLELRQRVLVQPELVALLPRAWQLQLIEDAELHDVSPATALFFGAECSPGRATLSSLRNCMAIPRRGSCLAWNARMIRLWRT